jgi:hypothetical protein
VYLLLFYFWCPKGRPRTAQPNKSTTVTTVDLSRFARPACVIIYNWLNDHSISLFIFRDTFSNVFYYAAKLVSECYGRAFLCYGMGSCGNEVGPAEVLMEIWKELGGRVVEYMRSECIITCSAYSYPAWSYLGRVGLWPTWNWIGERKP